MKNKTNQPSTTEGKLLALLTACLYGLFTLLPDSHSHMVAWPGVFLWQVSLLCPVLWLLSQLWQQRRFKNLGNGLDWLVAWVVCGLIVSTIFAKFPNQAFWYGWSALGFIATLYALNYYLNTPQRRYKLLIAQGYLNLAFIVVSLSLWTTQTLIPELSRLGKLHQDGVNLAYDFSILELRNWAPIGHQNYVAGYLLLALPLLVGLGILQTGWRRWLWLTGVGLGLLNLYTTSSRGGWLGLLVICLVSVVVLLSRNSFPRLWLGLGGVGTIALLCFIIVANNRLRAVIMAVLSGRDGGELGYRIININVGWQMGSTHPWSGIGLGGVPILYQKYRPIWAGRESEMIHQLHSTPAQLWAEMGWWGITAFFGAIALLIYLLVRWLGQTDIEAKEEQIFVWSLGSGLLAYAGMSLTDYQLDNICISGTLVIFLACLASILRVELPNVSSGKDKYARGIALTGLAIVVATIAWLVPVHQAWQVSDRGFTALIKDDIKTFEELLTKAQKLAPWEPYYPHQLGWNLGDLALKTSNSQQQQQLLTSSITSLQTGNNISPYQEFGHSNLGWLLLGYNPQTATQEFARSAQLIPAKRGVFYRLGLSLLAQGKVDLAIEAMSIEGLRNPLFISSPIWRSTRLNRVYPQVLDRMAVKYGKLLQQYSQSSSLNNYFHQCRGGLYWWRGDLAAASKDLKAHGTPLSKLILDLARGQKVEQELSQMTSSPSKLVIMAWLYPSQRLKLLQQAWIIKTRTTLPSKIEQQLLAGMEKSSNFEEWLKQKASVQQYRRQRSGFGVNRRHSGGAKPLDFWMVFDNVAMTTWFAELLPSIVYYPQLDVALQPQRDILLKAVLQQK